MSEEFFGRIKEFKELETASGSIKVPVLSTDVNSIWGIFPASASKCRYILPSDKLKPVLIGQNKTIYIISAFEYKASTLSPYNEVGTAVCCLYNPLINVPLLPAIFDRAFKVGFWVHHLPVTTKMAYDAGVDGWGYPKFYEGVEITFEETELTRSCILHEGRRHILTLEVKKGEATKSDHGNIFTYTVKDNMLLKTTLNFTGTVYSSKEPDAARLILGDHKMAHEIKALEVEPKCLRALYYPKMQIILNAGKSMELLRR